MNACIPARPRGLSLLVAAVGLALAWLVAPAQAAVHPLMQLTEEQEQRLMMEHFLAPQRAAPSIADDAKSLAAFPASMDLLSYWPYTPATLTERDQVHCGNCWQWAGTGVMEIAHAVEEGVWDRLSVQFISSCLNTVIADKACCRGGCLSDFARFYTAKGLAIPWSNTNAQFVSGWDTNCSYARCGGIGLRPYYRVSSIKAVSIRTHGVGQAQAIANIKSVLNQNRAVDFIVIGADHSAWDPFFKFWYEGPESAVWRGFLCGQHQSPGKAAGHEVVCLGYNEEDPANRYWLMINSWGNADGQRTNGIFRVSMDLNYDCALPSGGYAYYWETLDVQFSSALKTYAGLFTSTEATALTNSGSFTMAISRNKSFSAKLQLPGQQYSFSGMFPSGGVCSNLIPRRGLSPLTVLVWYDPGGGDLLRGQVGDGTSAAPLVANRAACTGLRPVPQAGKYTLLIPGGEAAAGQPGGNGFGTVQVDAVGNVQFIGALGDGTKVTQGTFLSRQGQWPLFGSLYSGSGSIFGWLTFTNEPGGDISGVVNWIKLAQPAAKFYPSGFSSQAEVAGSIYRFTNGVPLLNFSAAEVCLAGGNLPESFTNRITLGANNQVTNQSDNRLTLTLTTSSGLFKGSVAEPLTRQPITIQGAVLQSQNLGFGYFLGTSRSGRVLLGPASPEGP